MRNWIVVIGCVAVTWVLPPSYASGVKEPCGKHSSTAERAQCAEEELKGAEADMKHALSQAVALYTPGTSERGDAQQTAWERKIRADLNVSQSAWADYVRETCGAVADTYDKGTLTEVTVSECKAELTRQRTKILRDYFGSSR